MYIIKDRPSFLCITIILSIFLTAEFSTLHAQDAPFITTWKTTEVNEEIFIPAGGGSDFSDFDFELDWGDGTVEEFEGHVHKITHSYDQPGTYTVKITGVFPHLRMVSTDFPFDRDELENAAKLQTIEQWGDIQWESMERAFLKAKNMTSNTNDVPDLRKVERMNLMFGDAKKFNGNLSSWDVSNITDMRRMFTKAESFNSDISSWDVSNVTNMNSMFFDAKSFDADLSSWNVSKVTDMRSMFKGAESFNAEISSWDVSNVSDMSGMFENADGFNQDLNEWDVSSVKSMNGMFSHTDKFNGELAKWDVSNVTFMGSMFKGAVSFNGNLSNWNVSNVTSFEDNFDNGFLEGATLSTLNYDSLLIGWAQLNLQSDLVFDAGNSEFSENAKEARQSIIDEYNWAIRDGGKANGTDIEDKADTIPQEITLKQNYPNPFNPTTTIEYGLPEATEVRLTVYNLMGQEVATLVQERQAAGRHSVNFDAASLSSGIYIYRLEAGDVSRSRKLIMVK